MNFNLLTVSSLAICIGINLPVHAAPIEEIVVTADLRQATIMEASTSVTVVTEEAIRSRAAQHFEDVINGIANVNYASGSNRPRFFQIRGIGERSQFVNPVNPSIGFLIDDVDFSGAGTIATMMDVSQVEVLRGPQGTRYGANALGGLINVKTNDPESHKSALVKLSLGEYETETLGVVLNSPLTDTLNGRLVIESHESDGYIDNIYLDRDDTNGRDEMTVRGKLAWQADDDLRVNVSISKVDIDNGYDAFSLDNTRYTLSDEPGFDRQDTLYASIKSTLSLTNRTVEVLINQASSDMDYGYDEDWSFTGIHPWGYTSTDHYLRERDTRSIELRVISGEGSRMFSDTTDWIWGIYYLESDETLERQYTFADGLFDSEHEFNTLAAFLQFDSQISDRLTLGIGLRTERRDTLYDDSEGVSFSPDDTHWGGRLSLEYAINETTLGYMSLSRGYKAGGFNTDGTLDEDLRKFDEEYLIETEVGLKTSLLDGALQLQVSAFHNDRKDQQVKSSLLRVRQDNSVEFIDFFGNAASGTNKGMEIDLNWHFSHAVWMTANIGWLDAEFDRFINEFGEDLGGRQQAHAPDYSYSLAFNFEQGSWFGTVSTDGKDEFFFSDRHAVKSNSHALLNASIGYQSERWRLTIWGRNLSDKDYFVRAFGSFGNDPRKFYATEPYFQFGEPRMTGLTLEFSTGNR
jgi:outer membrane receptor protein involved in Fe transport